MAKINWLYALTDYISDEMLSYQAVASKYGVSKRAVVKKAKKENWQVLRKETLLKVHQKLPEKLGETLSEIKNRHLNFAKTLQQKGLYYLVITDHNPLTFREAMKCIEYGIKLERAILNTKNVSPPAIQIKIGNEEKKE